MAVKLRKKKISDGRFSLYVDVYVKGKPRKCNFLNIYLDNDREHNKEKLRIAEAIRAQKEVGLMYDKSDFPNPSKGKIDFVQYFLSKSKRNIRPKSKERYVTVSNHLKQFKQGAVPINSINEKFCTDFMNFLVTKEICNNTVRDYMTSLSVVLNLAVKEKIIQNNPLKGLDLVKKQETSREFLTIEEVTKLNETECEDEEVKNAFLFACMTGLRKCDVIPLKWSDVKNDEVRIVQQKTEHPLALPLNDTAKHIIEIQSKKKFKNDVVFGIPYKAKANKIFREWLKDAGIERRIIFHSGRHTHALLLLENGESLYTVSQLLGHKSINTTQIYAHILDKTKKNAVDRLPQINLKK